MRLAAGSDATEGGARFGHAKEHEVNRQPYKAEKRRKEIARQKKQEEKRQKRLEKKQGKGEGAPEEGAAVEGPQAAEAPQSAESTPSPEGSQGENPVQ